MNNSPSDLSNRFLAFNYYLGDTVEGMSVTGKHIEGRICGVYYSEKQQKLLVQTEYEQTEYVLAGDVTKHESKKYEREG
jgi:hypothetical protein